MSQARLLKICLIIGFVFGIIVFQGCEEKDNFDPADLFSLKDFADDGDYFISFLDMMDRFREAHKITVSYLGGTERSIDFDEFLPDGWQESAVLPGWYQRTSADASDEFIRFDHSITAPDEIKPVKGEYFRFNLDSLSVGTYAAFGDSFSVIYAENGRNITVLEGEASYIDTRVLFRGSGGVGNFSGAAGMFNVWNAKFENLSAEPGLLAGQHRIEGVTQINDLNDEIDLDVVINLNMRANSSGEATIWVEGIKRVEIDFSGYDVHFRGKVSLAMDDFEREYNF